MDAVGLSICRIDAIGFGKDGMSGGGLRGMREGGTGVQGVGGRVCVRETDDDFEAVEGQARAGENRVKDFRAVGV